MRRIALPSLTLATVVACSGAPVPDDDTTSDAGQPPVQLSYCAGASEASYDPLSKQLTIFPDDFWTDDDATTATGRKLNLKPGVNVDVPATVTQFGSLYGELALLDGFGTTAALTLRLNGELDPASLPPSGDGSGKADASVVLVKLGAAAEFVDFEWQLIPESVADPKHTLVVSPMKPLAPKAEYALVLTQRAKDRTGGCVAPSQVMKDLLDGKSADPALVRLQPRLAGVVDALVKTGTLRAKEDVSAAVVFTTQHTTEGSQAIAADIRARTFEYEKLTCSVSNLVRRCEGKFTAGDYRDLAKHIDEAKAEPRSTYKLTVTTWLPAATPATRTIVFGHGLGGSRTQIAAAAPDLTAAGYAIAAIDAPKHGAHPDKAGLLGAAELFGVSVNLSTFQAIIDSRSMRDNMRQAAYDKLQLVELLKAGIDVDGDGTADLKADKLAYLGLSLGGIMGPELLAYAPEIKAAVLMVPGARLSDILRESENFQAAVQQFRGAATDGDFARVFAMMQAAIERGDPAASAPHVLADRLPGFDAGAPQVLQQMVINDDVVPNATNRFFARAMGLPLLGDELQAIGSVPRIATLPATDTVRAGLSAGVFQYDVIEGGVTATHNNLAGSQVAWAQLLPFLESAFAGSGELRDPYRDLSVK